MPPLRRPFRLPRPAVRVAIFAATVAAIAAACTDFGTGPDEAVALDFGAPQLPALAAGDTLRDSLGAPAPLAAVAINADGDTIADAGVRYYALDTTAADVDSVTGFVTGKRVGTVRVIASVAGLQSQPLTLTVTHRPDGVFALDTLEDTVQYSIADPAANVDTLPVFVGHDTVTAAGADTVIAVPGWLVRYRIVQPAGLDPRDPQGTLLVGFDNARPASADTTDASGIARLLLRIASRPPVPDTVVVEVLVNGADGAPLAGTPIRFTTVVVSEP